jgi:hypothetical protein
MSAIRRLSRSIRRRLSRSRKGKSKPKSVRRSPARKGKSKSPRRKGKSKGSLFTHIRRSLSHRLSKKRASKKRASKAM